MRRQLLATEYNSENHLNSDHCSILEILKTKQLCILGHIIDPEPLLSPIITKFMRKSIDIAISRFENSDITQFTV